MLEIESDNSFLNYEFESGEDAIKMAIFNFLKLAMMGRERRQHMDWTLLDFIDVWEVFYSYNWGHMLF